MTMLRMFAIFAFIFFAPDLLAAGRGVYAYEGYDGNSFPLRGWRFLGYEGTGKPMYEMGWLLLWVIWPIFAAICLKVSNEIGCIGKLIAFVVCGSLCFFWLCNLDYFLGFTLGLMIFGCSSAKAQALGD